MSRSALLLGRSQRSAFPGSFGLRLALTAGINVLALIVVDRLFDGVAIRGFWSYALGALALALGNAFVKPVLALLTLPLILVTLGLAYVALNVAMLALAEWIAPRFSVDGFWTYVGATIVVWLLNVCLRALLDRVAGGANSRLVR